MRRLSGKGIEGPELPELDLFRRRVPQFVALTMGVAGGFVALASDFVQNSGLRRAYFWVAVALAGHAIIASFVLSWFHGARGKQQVQPLEMTLLAAIGASVLAVSVLILLG